VLLVKTVKGYGMGKAGEGKNTVHQTKKLTDEDIKYIRDRFNIPIPTASWPRSRSTSRPTTRRKCVPARAPQGLGGYLPTPHQGRRELHRAVAGDLQGVLEPTAEGREISTTQAYVRFLTSCCATRRWARAWCPSWWTRPAPSAWKGCSARSASTTPQGQLYTPVDKDQVMYYKEDKAGPDPAGRHQRGRRHGQLDRCGHQLQHQQPHHGAVLRVLLDVRLPAHRRPGLGGGRHAGARLPAGRHLGRTTLNGEGLQHEDGHSHILAGTIPNCISYDPTFAHEVGVILHHGLKRMVEKQDNVFYYLTLLNENYAMPGLTARHRRADHQGHVPVQGRRQADAARAAAGQRHHPARVDRGAGAAGEDWGVAANVWSCPASTSWPATARTPSAGTCCTRPRTPRVPFVSQQLAAARRPGGGVHRLHEGLRRADPPLHPQGPQLPRAGHRRLWPQRLPQQAARALRGQPPLHRGRRPAALADEGTLPVAKVAEAIKKYGIKTDKINPLYA
jgi:pyruvate dehydrogenase E1 component